MRFESVLAAVCGVNSVFERVASGGKRRRDWVEGEGVVGCRKGTQACSGVLEVCFLLMTYFQELTEVCVLSGQC